MSLGEKFKKKYKDIAGHFKYKLALFFLGQKNLTPEKKKEFKRIGDKIIADMRSSGLFSYNGVDLTDAIAPQLMGYSTNLASAVKAHILSKFKIKSKIFNLNYFFRFLRRHVFNPKATGMYNLRLFEAEPVKKIEKKYNKKFDVALICNCASFLNSFTEVIRSLEKQNKDVLFIVPKLAVEFKPHHYTTPWKHILVSENKPKNIHILCIEDYFTEERKKKLFELREHFTKLFRGKKAVLKKILTIGNSSLYWPLKIRLNKFASEYLPECVIYNEIAEEILKEYKVKTLVGGRIKRFVENSFYIAARDNKIRTVCIIHVYHEAMLDIFYDLSQVDLVDYVFVPSNYDQQLFSERKSPESKTKIICLGNPQMQKIYDLTSFENYKKKFNLNNDFAVFVSGTGLHPLSWIENVLEVCKEAGHPLFIKLHPIETKERYKQLAEKGAIVVDDSEISFYSLMKEARLVIAYASTANLESVLIGTPSLLYRAGPINLSNVYYFYDFFGKLGFPILTKKKELKKAVHYYFSTPKDEALKQYQKFLELFSIVPEKNIAESIAEFILHKRDE